MSEELVIIDEAKALEIFSQDGGLTPFLDEVAKIVEEFKPDTSTPKGRKEIAAHSHRVSKFKVKVDDMGKELVAGWKAQSKLVDASRKHARDTLDALRDKARQPLTDWEQIDKDRISDHEYNLEGLRNAVNVEEETAAAYALRLQEVKTVEMGKCWEEFAADAAEAKDEVILFLEREIAAATKREAEAAELEQLRKAAAAREQEDRDASIAKEATEKAEKEGREREAKLTREKEEAEGKLKEAEERRLGAIEQAKRDEAARIQREKDAEEAIQSKLAANKRHRGKIEKETRASLLGFDMDVAQADLLIERIAAGNVANVTINY